MMTTRQQQALALRLQGVAYSEIGASLGVTRQCAQQMVRPRPKTRQRITERAAGACESCRVPFTRPGQIHHRQTRGMPPETYNAIENLMLLCGSCHSKAHRDPAVAERKRLRRENAPQSRALGDMKRAAKAIGVPFEAYRGHRENGERWCSVHRKWEDAGRFGTTKGRPAYVCREGNQENVRRYQGAAYARDYYHRNPERMRAYQREYKRRRHEREEARNAERAS